MKSWSEAISVDDQKFLWILFKHEMPSNPPCRTAYCRGGIYINNMVMNMNSSICRWFVRVLFFFLTENHHLREPFCFYVQSKTLRHLNNCMPYLDLIIFYPCVGDEQNSIAKKNIIFYSRDAAIYAKTAHNLFPTQSIQRFLFHTSETPMEWNAF